MFFFGNISRTWELMGQSWGVLKQDKEMLVFPLVSGLCCLLVTASFLIPTIINDTWLPPGTEIQIETTDGQQPAAQQPPVQDTYTDTTTAEKPTTGQYVAYYSKLFLFYFCNYFVIIFFNAAIAGCASMRMRGQDPTLVDGFSIAFSRLHAIFGWAIVSATVGIILRMIEDKNQKVGHFIASLLGTAWTLISFLVLPILVIENMGPFGALKKSAAMLKKTWGAQIGANFSFGVIFFLLFLPVIGIIALGFFLQSGLILGICIAVGVLYAILLSLVQSALSVIFQTALYYFADTGTAPDGFGADTLQGAVAQK